MRAAVARALGAIGDSATLLPLLAARGGDVSAAVRAAAADALAEWEFVPLLEILESTAEPALRAAAAQLMGEGRFAEAITPLGEALRDAQEQVREAPRHPGAGPESFAPRRGGLFRGGVAAPPTARTRMLSTWTRASMRCP